MDRLSRLTALRLLDVERLVRGRDPVLVSLLLEVVGGLAGAVGITLGILGALNAAKVVVERNLEKTTADWVPRILPWAAAVDDLRGGAGGVVIVF